MTQRVKTTLKKLRYDIDRHNILTMGALQVPVSRYEQ